MCYIIKYCWNTFHETGFGFVARNQKGLSGRILVLWVHSVVKETYVLIRNYMRPQVAVQWVIRNT